MLHIIVLSSAKPIATQILVITKLNRRKDFALKGCVSYDMILASKQLSVQSYQIKHNNKV